VVQTIAETKNTPPKKIIKFQSVTYTFQDLISIMERLRTGCPWDREQTTESLLPYLVEESAEFIDAAPPRSASTGTTPRQPPRGAVRFGVSFVNLFYHEQDTQHPFV
jgi:hypothetical protein